MLSQLYKPTNQKLLFNQPCLNEIKKWLKTLNDDKNYKKILFIYGSNGCGKTTTLDLLFKNYNVININPDDIRVSECMNELLTSIINYDSNTIQTTKKASLGNLLLIDNIKHCEKTINNFINVLYENNKNIPLIICCTELSIRQKFKSDYNITYIDFNTLTKKELTKLITTIFNDKNFKITEANINNIIETALNNLHQVYFIIEHILASNKPDIDFDVLKQDHDIDLNEKIKILFNFENEYDFKKIDELTEADSNVICNNIFQNYLQFYDKVDNNDNDNDLINKLENLSLTCDSFNTYNVCNFEVSEFDNVNCIHPIYRMHEYNKVYENNKVHESKPINYTFEHYSGISYNYINNLNEINTFMIDSFNNLNNDVNKTLILDKNIIWDVIKLTIQNLNLINEYLNIKKRNVKPEDYIEILKNKNVYEKFMHVVDIIWNYTLFETNNDILKIKYKKDDIEINLRIFKRLINIHSFENTTKILKTSTENIIKYELINKLISLQDNNVSIKNDDRISNLICDLNDIWAGCS